MWLRSARYSKTGDGVGVVVAIRQDGENYVESTGADIPCTPGILVGVEAVCGRKLPQIHRAGGMPRNTYDAVLPGSSWDDTHNGRTSAIL